MTQTEEAVRCIHHKQFDKAEEILRAVLRNRDAPPTIFQLMALAAEGKGENRRALRVWSDMVRYFPGEGFGVVGYTRLLNKLGKVRTATWKGEFASSSSDAPRRQRRCWRILRCACRAIIMCSAR